MITIPYMGCSFKESTSFQINRPTGSGNFLLLLFLSDVYIQDHLGLNHYESGTAVLYLPTHPQFYHNPVSGFNNDWIHFEGNEIDSFLSEIGFPVNQPIAIPNITELHQRIQRIEQELLMKNKTSPYMIDILMKEMFLFITENNSISSEPFLGITALESQFRKLRSVIMSQLENSWSIESMAKLMNLSPSRFSHLYLSIFHISPKKDLLNERMNMARFLLQSRSYSIGDVARKVGYDNIYHFSKQFKTSVGKPPSAFR